MTSICNKISLYTQKAAQTAKPQNRKEAVFATLPFAIGIIFTSIPLAVGLGTCYLGHQIYFKGTQQSSPKIQNRVPNQETEDNATEVSTIYQPHADIRIDKIPPADSSLPNFIQMLQNVAQITHVFFQKRTSQGTFEPADGYIIRQRKYSNGADEDTFSLYENSNHKTTIIAQAITQVRDTIPEEFYSNMQGPADLLYAGQHNVSRTYLHLISNKEKEGNLYKGLGFLLISAIIQQSEHGKRIELGSVNHSQPFYYKMGFRVTPQLNNSKEMNKIIRDSVITKTNKPLIDARITKETSIPMYLPEEAINRWS